jgi:Putative auto-transporter adhesin, head GIN domain
MKQLFLFLSIATVTFFSSCSKEIIRGSGSIGNKTINVPAFTAVESHYDIKAVISYGTSQEVTATGYDNLLNILDFKVENGVLKLKFNTTYNTIRNGNVAATIKLPFLSGVAIHGSKNIEVSGFANGNTFDAKIHGSGSIRVSSSSYQSAVLDVHGSGSIDAEGLQTKQAESNIHGSGNSSVSVSEKLAAKIFGSGNIYYRGNPALEIVRNGSGKVIKR